MIRDWTPLPIPEPGAYRGVDTAVIRAWPGMSPSRLKKARGGYPADWLRPVEPTAAMDRGSAVDCLVYDGAAAFASRFPPVPEVRKGNGGLYSDYLGSKPGAAWRAEQEAAGRTVLTSADREIAISTAAAVAAHPLAALLIAAGESQVSMLWQHEGRWRKGRADTIIHHSSPRWAEVEAELDLPEGAYCGAIVDLKTTGPAQSGRARTPREFAGHSYSYGYHLQMGWYEQGARETVDPGHWACVLIQATTAEPWPVEVHVMDEEMVSVGLRAMDALDALYYQCQAANTWPNTLSARAPHRMSLERWQIAREEGF